MKRSHLLTAVFAIAILLTTATACSKLDDNGDFGGSWQLLEWTDKADGKVVATNADGIYLNVRNELINIQSTSRDGVYLATFSLTADSLILHDIYLRPDDTLVPADSLRPYGDDGTGRYAVESLTSSRMTLVNRTARLVFRKY